MFILLLLLRLLLRLPLTRFCKDAESVLDNSLFSDSVLELSFKSRSMDPDLDISKDPDLDISKDPDLDISDFNGSDLGEILGEILGESLGEILGETLEDLLLRGDSGHNFK